MSFWRKSTCSKQSIRMRQEIPRNMFGNMNIFLTVGTKEHKSFNTKRCGWPWNILRLLMLPNKKHTKKTKKIALLPNLYFNSVAQKQESSFKMLGLSVRFWSFFPWKFHTLCANRFWYLNRILKSFICNIYMLYLLAKHLWACSWHQENETTNLQITISQI